MPNNLKFPEPADLQKKIDEYFNTTPKEEYTVTGLALLIGSKQLLNDYEKREGYKDIVHIAKLRVENSYEISLRKKGSTGDIFALKNFGWKDKTEQETTHKGSLPPIIFESK